MMLMPIKALLCLFFLVTMHCHSLNLNSSKNKVNLFDRQYLHQQHQQQKVPEINLGVSRRRVLYESMTTTTAAFATAALLPRAADAYDTDNKDNFSSSSSNGIVTVRIESSRESLGVEVYDTILRGKTVVAIRRIIVSNKNNKSLREGMILGRTENSISSSKELVEKLRSGPYPIELNFYNLAAGGDAIGDLGTSIVKPKDALELAQKTDGNEQQGGVGYDVTTILKLQPQQQCAIKSRRNDVLEIIYEASYVDNKTGENIIYDASAFRGTGNDKPYQMVLGSGDMIPGVDQGLYDMCPGETRLLEIPPVLGHGPRSRKLFRIPSDYVKLVWKINLVSIDSTIQQDNNIISRDERESRFAYD